MIKKKSVVLSDTEETNRKAVLSLEEDDAGVKGTLRLYNFSRDLGGISSLGFLVDQKVYKAGLTFKSPMLYEFFTPFDQIPKNFSCAVINFQNAEAKAVLYGSSDGNDEVYASIISELAKETSASNTQSVLDKYGVDFEEEEKKEIEKEIDKAICEENGNCANCVYKKYFYEHNSSQTATTAMSNEKMEENLEKEPEKSEKNEEIPSFIEKLRPQIDKLFEDNPIENNLQTLIPNSKWIKVDYEDDGDFYVFGLLYDEKGEVKYVCYGVPAVYETEAPKELSGYPIWIPLDKENEQGFGYWLTYQDATTGEPIKAIIE